MTKTRSTKSALIFSALSLLLCFTMLLGTTFAWFTDSVTSANNIIMAGNLDVELYHTDKSTPAEGKVTKQTTLFDDVTLWEPGVMVWEELTVKNEGDLALKYQLTLNVLNATKVGEVSFASMLKVALVDGDFEYTRENVENIGADEWKELATFSLADELNKEESDVYGIVIWWQPSNNDDLFNMNNGKTDEVKVEIGVTLLATQLDAEEDAFGKDYDADLEPTTTYMFSGEDLHNSTTKSGRFELAGDITTSESTARYGYGYEYIIRKGADYTLDLNGKTIVHDTVNENANHDAFTYLFVANNAGSKLTIDGEGKVYSGNSAGYACAVQGKDGTLVTVNGGDFEVDNGIAVWAGAGSHIVINGGSFVNGNATTSHELIYSSGGVIDIYGGFFHNTDGNYTLNVEDRNRATGFINVYGGTYVNFDPSTGGQDPNNIKVADGYKVTSETKENGDIWYTVVPVNPVSGYDSLTSAEGTSGHHALVDNVEASDKIYFGDNTTNTIDLNGKTVTATGGYLFATQGENCVLTIEGNGEVNANSAYAGFANKGSTLNVNGGSFQLDNTNNKGHFYAQNSSTIVINDGEFISTDADTPIIYCINAHVEINGGFFQNTANPSAALIGMGNNLNYVNNQKVTLRGGTFVNWNPMDSAFAKPWTNPDVPALIVLADGYEMVSETQTNGDVWYTVVPIE